ncbi:MAG: glycosyltransferase [Alphaproteobacteria bacterium]|nr:MAG: glycosyltransferase [Alphaproteobacteria bacterium]
MKVLFAVTHLMGAGHLVRSLALARAVNAAGGQALVLSGGRPLAHLDTAGVELLQLPPLRADGLNYRRLLDEGGEPVDEPWLARRRAAALGALHAFAPDILVTETWPFGRGSLGAEFAALVAAQRARGGRVFASIRDIPEPPSTERKRLRAETALAGFDGVLVHGDARLGPFTRYWPLSGTAAGLLHHTGYVAEPLPEPIPTEEVLVAVGGGVIGRPLLQIAARAAALSSRPWRLLAGGADAAAFGATLPGPALAEPARADYRARLAGAACSVSLAGYNTVADLLQCATPAVLVPMAEGGEREQALRGQALAGSGFAVLQIGALTPERLAAAVEDAIAAGPRHDGGIVLDGAAASARILLGPQTG